MYSNPGNYFGRLKDVFPDKGAIASLLWSMKHKASEQLNRHLSVVNMIPAWYADSTWGKSMALCTIIIHEVCSLLVDKTDWRSHFGMCFKSVLVV